VSPARHTRSAATAVLTLTLTAVLVAAACGRAPLRAAATSSPRPVPPIGEPAVVVTPAVAAPVAAARRAAAGPNGVDDVDWRSVTFRSVCGLGDVQMVDGQGGRYVDGTAYGVQVVDVAVADLTGDARPDAAVLVDCLGGQAPYPHVVVVTSDGVGRRVDAAAGSTSSFAVAPVSGGSVGPGERPVSVAVGPSGRITVTTDVALHELRYAPGVLQGGEIAVAGPVDLTGTVLDAVDGILTLALTADDGYRIPYDRSEQVTDVRTGRTVTLDALVGQDVSVFVDADGRAGSVQHLPRGPG
jgi:hypothetical protein